MLNKKLLLLLVFVGLFMFLVLSNAVSSAKQCYLFDFYQNDYIYTIGCGADCGTPSDEVRTCEECYDAIPDPQLPKITSYCNSNGDNPPHRFWGLKLGTCFFGYRDVRCWKVFARKTNLSVGQIILNNEPPPGQEGKSCDQICSQAGKKCVGISWSAYGGNHGSKGLSEYYDEYLEGYECKPSSPTGDCSTIISNNPDCQRFAYCYCLGCEPGYKNCNNNWNDGCECPPEKVCDGTSCVDFINYCITNYSGWVKFDVNHASCEDFNEGCVTDTNGDGIYDTVCCPVYNDYYKKIMFFEPSRISISFPWLRCREMK